MKNANASADINIDNHSTLDIRIYYEDTDAGGVVFYANYLKFLERGRTEWLRRLGFDQTRLAQTEQRLFVVKQLDIQYLRPARLDDLITVHSTLTRVGRASLQFHQTASMGPHTLCTSAITLCCVDAATFKPTGLPDFLRHSLRNLLCAIC